MSASRRGKMVEVAGSSSRGSGRAYRSKLLAETGVCVGRPGCVCLSLVHIDSFLRLFFLFPKLLALSSHLITSYHIYVSTVYNSSTFSYPTHRGIYEALSNTLFICPTSSHLARYPHTCVDTTTLLVSTSAPDAYIITTPSPSPTDETAPPPAPDQLKRRPAQLGRAAGSAKRALSSRRSGQLT